MRESVFAIGTSTAALLIAYGRDEIFLLGCAILSASVLVLTLR